MAITPETAMTYLKEIKEARPRVATTSDYSAPAYILVNMIFKTYAFPVTFETYTHLREGFGHHMPTGWVWLRLEPDWGRNRNPIARHIAEEYTSLVLADHPGEVLREALLEEVGAAVEYIRFIEKAVDPITGKVPSATEALSPLGGNTPATWAFKIARQIIEKDSRN